MAKRRTVTTEAELNALPEGSVILWGREAYQKHRRVWCEASHYEGHFTSQEIAKPGFPITVLYTGAEA